MAGIDDRALGHPSAEEGGVTLISSRSELFSKQYSSSPGGAGSSKQLLEAQVEEDPSKDAWKKYLNFQKPVEVEWDGKRRHLVDGLGLCSPLRLHPSSRRESCPPGCWDFSVKLAGLIDGFVETWFPDAQRSVISLALGKTAKAPFSEQDMMTLRAEWFALLPDPGQAAIVPEFQPFFLHALGQSLKIMGDPDWEIFCGTGDSYSNGVPVGVGIAMPRTPEVFRRKERWRKYDDSDFVCEMDNYLSAKEAGGALRKQFLEEADLGMMFEIPLSEARERYPGDSLRITAQGAIEKSDDTFRILHDGTHGVRINNEIQVRDQLDFSGPGDAAATMQSSLEEANGVQFAIAGDIKKAHRKVLHRKADWGLMACWDSSEGDSVWTESGPSA
jgi:hypothetical protein